MSKINWKSVIQYTISLVVAIGLLYYLLSDIDWENFKKKLISANYFWIGVSIVTALLAHFSRAIRWIIILETIGFRPRPGRTFVAVMVGYFANILAPRMGEVSRCGILKKTDKIPMTASFGTVVAERAFDLVILLSISALTVLIQFKELKDTFYFMMDELLGGVGEKWEVYRLYIYGAIALGIITIVLFFVFRKRLQETPIYIKVVNFLADLAQGFTAILKVKKKGWFFFHTIMIWVMYYFMSYVMFFSMEETSHLGILAGFTLLVVGGLGMAAPVQGGIGAFHLFVQSFIVAYGISATTGLVFATLMHTSQAIMLITAGAISFFVSLILKPRNAQFDPSLSRSSLIKTPVSQKVG